MPEQTDARGKPRKAYQTVNKLPSKTVQSEQHQADIKHILRRYREVGIIEHLNITEASFPDVTDLGDFADVMRTAKQAETEFMKLPSKIREKFGHDVATWLDYAHDEEKRASLLKESGEPTQQQPTQSNPIDNPPGDAGPGTSNPASSGG